MADSGQNTTQEMRRKRIKLYKKIIVFFLLFLILLPTIFCVILFVRVGHLERQLNVLMAMRVSETDDDLPGDTTQEAKTDRNINPDYVYANETESDTSTEAGTVDAAENETPELEERDSDKHVSGQPQDDVHGAYSETMIEEALQDGRKVVYLTFDDGPHPEYTPILLDLLASYHIPATFFVVTEFARKNPALIQRMQAEGHLIGFHSASHRSAYLMTPKQTRSDFSDGLEALAQLGISPQYFRPPWGVVNWASLRQIRARHLRLVLWDVMAQDWKRSMTPDEIARRLRLRAYPGAVICLHDGRGNAGAPGRTIQALQTLLPQWLEQGFRFQTLDLYE